MVGHRELACTKGICEYTGTNNEAEFFALIMGLGMAKKLGLEKLTVYGDSQLIIGYMGEGKRPGVGHLREWKARARRAEWGFQDIQYRWQSRETPTSQRADRLAAWALEQYAG